MTDAPEIVAAIELYNKNSDEVRISPLLVNNIDKALLREAKPDLVISRNINSNSLYNEWENVYKNGKGLVDLSNIYHNLIEEENRLVPLSFSLPSIVFSKENSIEQDNPITIEIEQLILLTENYATETSSGIPTTMGFSPLWNNSFLIWLCTLYSVDLSDRIEEIENKPELDELKNFLLSWSENNTLEYEFSQKYRNIPDPILVKGGRIGFCSISVDEFFRIADKDRSLLDFRYISHDNSIPLDKTLFGAIPRSSTYTTEAAKFLNWLLSEEAQKEIIPLSREYNYQSFGFLNGFSTIPEINWNTIPNYYPELEGKFPPENEILSYKTPLYWETLQEEVFIKWLDSIYNNRSRPLSEFYMSWRNLNPEFDEE